MALATHSLNLKGSCGTFPSVPSLWSKGSKLKHCVPLFPAVKRKDSVGASFSLRPKPKLYKRSTFKDEQFDDSNGGIINGSMYLKNAVKVSYLKHKSEDSSSESLNVQSDVPAPQAASVEATTRSLAIQNLFKSWLTLLHKPSQTQAASEIIEESSLAETSEMPTTLVKQNGVILKAVWCHISNLDMMIRIPFLVFTPLYLVVNLAYGMEVSKELTPLWVLGPLVVALYIKIFRALCGLYAFSFKQTVTVLKNLPVYYLLVHDRISHRKLKETMRIHISELVADIRNMNYNEVTRRKLKDLQGWFIERQLDFIELVWPYYCRTIRFLKRTNFI